MAKEYIEQRDGNYYVVGTSISLDSIIHGAIAHYLANQAAVDAYLIRQGEKWAEGKRSSEPLPSDLRERLMRAREEMHTIRPS